MILSDLDDVALCCADSFQIFLEQEYDLVSAERLQDHHNVPKLYNVSESYALELVAAFHRSDYFGKLPAMPCAAVVLPELRRQGYKFVGITACLNEPKIVEARLQNLFDAFGFEWEIHCVGIKASKKEALQLYPTSIWVEDLAHNASVGAEVGHRSFLINKPYNKDSELHFDVTRVNDWHDIKNLL